jgi:ATP-dependent DNA helicase RecQ
MLVRVFTLGFSPATGRFDDTQVRDFLADKEAVSIDHHFFAHDGIPYLALVVCYRPGASGSVAAAAPGPAAAAGPDGARAGRGRDESWRDALEQSQWPLFNRLREWRGERARAEGIPPYVICNNRQLADMVQRKPATLAALGELDGFGEAKLKKYGPDLLGLIARAGAEPGGGDDPA